MGETVPASGLQLACGHLAVLGVAFEFVVDLLAFTQLAQTRALDRGDVHEDVRAAGVGLDETVALRAVEPFHSTGSHLDLVLWEDVKPTRVDTPADDQRR